MREHRRMGWLIWALCGLGGGMATGCAEPGITVTISDQPAGTERILVRTFLDGTHGEDILIDPGQSQFVVRLPVGSQGTLRLEAIGYDTPGCKLATGMLEESVPGGLRPYIDRIMAMSSLTPRQCTLTVEVFGEGSTTLDPSDLACAGGQTCEFDFPADTSVTLNAKAASLRTYPSYSGSCLGTAPSQQVIMDRARRVAVEFTPRICTPQNWCWYNPLPQGEPLLSLWGSSTDDVWAVGGTGTLLHWNGRAWSSVESGATKDLRSIWGSDRENVWVVGDGGTVLHWDGRAWSAKNPGTTNNLYAVWTRSPTDVWVLGDAGIILQFNGSGWVPRPPPGMITGLNSIWGSVAGDIWVVGNGGAILRWTGGPDWLPLGQPATMNNLRSVWGSAPNDVWAVGDGGTILRYNGTQWAVPPDVPKTSTVFSVRGGAANDVWILGYGTSSGTSLHWDGSVWSQMSNSILNNLNAVWTIGNNEAWAVGHAGKMVHGNGSEWLTVSSGTTDHLYAVWASGPDDVWAVGDGVTHWDGTGWSLVPVGSVKPLFGIWGSSSKDVWAVGEHPTKMLHLESGSWLPKDVSGGPFGTLWGSGPSDIWAVGTGRLLHWNGTAWAQPTPPVSVDFSSLYGSARDNVWAVRNPSTIHWYDGTSWAAVPTGLTGGNLYSVWTGGPDQVWAVGQGGLVVQKTGALWSKETVNRPVMLMDVWGAGASDVWAAGSTGIFHRDSAWSEVFLSYHQYFRAIWGNGPGDIWVVGDRGAILRYQK